MLLSSGLDVVAWWLPVFHFPAAVVRSREICREQLNDVIINCGYGTLMEMIRFPCAPCACLLAGFASLLTAAVLRVYGFLGWAWPKAFSVVVVVVVAVGTVQYEEGEEAKMPGPPVRVIRSACLGSMPNLVPRYMH